MPVGLKKYLGPSPEASPGLKDRNGLTVVVSCKNRMKNLEFFLCCIEHSQPQPLVILVDFGSDESLSYLEKLYSSFLKVIRVERAVDPFHKTRAINIGLKRVNTAYTMMTDVDQIFPSNFFGVIHSKLRTRVGFITGYSFMLDDIPGFLNSSNVSECYNRTVVFAQSNGARLDGFGCCIATDTAWIHKVHGLDERYVSWGLEDLEFVRRAAHNKRHAVYFNKLGLSAVHLPHEKVGAYYSIPCSINENIYKNFDMHRNAVVNNDKWGEI